MFATCRCTVCSLRTSDEAISRLESPAARPDGPSRHHRHVQTRHIDGLAIRLLRNGDTRTVSALFERLGPRSRERRFCGAKPRLSTHDLRVLAPVGIARLVRDGRTAEVAFAVADEYQGGVESARS